MYQPRHFEERRPEVLHRLMVDHPLALLIHHGPDGLAANPLPLLHDADGGEFGCLRGHVARANPLWQQVQDSPEVLVVFQGPQAYVSPNWYPAKAEHGKVVPTWNYCIVQARGRLRCIDDKGWLRTLVQRLTDRHEVSLPQPWAVDDAPEIFVDHMLGAIVGIELPIEQLVGKWKVSQNRSAADRAGVVDGLLGRPGDDARAMASQVADPGG
ncbi:FMN-binding negative transcriptional regulator [Piscinibacter sakaiensis]|uniref:FMN-binding negative transcriptional regulator n=1 Tax=Piscinibacter sakaiensis TaxID=1547922 RepID=UPI003AAB19B9